jgi:hypothetical protein
VGGGAIVHLEHAFGPIDTSGSFLRQAIGPDSHLLFSEVNEINRLRALAM